MENLPQKQNREMIFAGHVDEIDDLRKYRRDAPLKDSEKNCIDLSKISNAIISKMRQSGKKAVIFITSPRIRAKETAVLVALAIKKQLGEEIKIRYSTDEKLKLTEQGEFILPKDYIPGEFFEGLKIASEIFLKESINNLNQNLHYQFGDPVIQQDGSFKYPELAELFIKSGETYAQSLSRIFLSVIEMGYKIHKINSSYTEVVLIAHGFTYHILRGLVVLGEQIKQKNININTGELANILWEIYSKREGELRDIAYAPLDITNLEDEELLELLKKEIKFLEN